MSDAIAFALIAAFFLGMYLELFDTRRVK